jgi:oxalate decarboxylase
MSDISRRQALGATAAAATALTATLTDSAAGGEKPAGKAKSPTHKFRLAEAPLKKFNGGHARLFRTSEFPIAKQVSMALMTLEPGGMREPHWHPNCVECDYILAGRFRFNCVHPGGVWETFEAGAGDVVYFPQGYAHYFENVGAEDATLLITFNDGNFEEIGISEWVAESPKDSFSTTLNLPKGALDKAPDHGLFITSKKNPGK